MKPSSYGERDYAFGQAMLTLRSALGLTQAGLAEFLGVSRKAVGGWESGGSYPKAEHLKALLTLAVQEGTFPAAQFSLFPCFLQDVLIGPKARAAPIAPSNQNPAEPTSKQY